MTTTSFASLPSTGVSDSNREEKYKQLADLPTEQLLAEAVRILRYELDLSGYERRRHVLDRLHTWLEMDSEKARRLAIVFDDCAAGLETSERDDIDATTEDAVMDGLSYAEFQRLAELMPSLGKWRQSIPESIATGSFGSSLAAVLALAATTDLT